MLSAQAQQIAALAVRHRLPGMYWAKWFVEAGGLAAYSADDDDLTRRAAYYVDRILKGTRPADLPVEQPTKFELVINLKTATALGLTIPQSMLLRADQVIACACSTQARHVHNLPAHGLREFEGFFPGLERRRRERGAVAMESGWNVATRWPHGAVGQNRA